MKRLLKIAPMFAATALAGCSVSGLLGGGGKAPLTLQTLSPEVADPGNIARSASAGQALTIDTPIISSELRTLRVPVQLSQTDVQYVTDLRWVDTPDRLFRNLLEAVVERTTDRVVLDPDLSGLDPGTVLHGELERFGFDAQRQQVVVAYDCTLAGPGGSTIQKRRFVASAPADGTGASVGPALNHAANEVALEVAKWIGSQAG